MTLRRYYVIVGLFAVLSCQNDLPPFAPVAYLISTNENGTVQRNFDQCTLRYAFRNEPRTINISSLQKSLEAPFDQWQQANGYIEFTRVASNATADIGFVFSDSLQISNRRTDVGLVSQSINALSQLKKQADGTYTVYLLNTYRWDVSSLQRVLLFQIGAALGLPASTNPESAMSNRITTTAIALDSADVKAIQQLYNQPCDQWTRLANLPFDGRNIETSVATSRLGFVLMNAGDGQSAFWEFTPATTNWRSRTPYPITQIDRYGFSPNRLGFAIDTLLFVGNSYNNNLWEEGKSGTFWQYKPAVGQATDRWVPSASQPQIGYGTGRSFSVSGRGYIVTMALNTTYQERIIVCSYDPVQNTWIKQPTLERKSDGVYSLGETFSFVLNQQAYLVSPDNSLARSWLFDPAQPNPWVEIATFNEASFTKTGFAVRGVGYGMSGKLDLPKGVWRYKPEQGWKRLKDFPGQGNLLFSFVLGNRAYVGTSSGQFWTYRP